MRECKDCKWAELGCLRSGYEFPTCTRPFIEWFECRKNDLSMYEKREKNINEESV